MVTKIDISLIGRRELTSEDVKKLVFESISLIADTQTELDLPICPNIHETREILKGGRFRARRLRRRRAFPYQMAYGSFEPPDTITLDSKLPFCDKPYDIPEIPYTMSYYTATHEVVHADDHTGGDLVYKATKEHILVDHLDKLGRGMDIIEMEGGCELVHDYNDLASLWAVQYIDMITHFRAFATLRHRGFPKLDMIWEGMQNGFFPPNILTRIESERGIRYIFDVIRYRAGEYCLIDALMESESIRERNTCSYTV